MLLTVLIMSGSLLGATTIAGLLMLYQIRQSTNVSDSTRAIYAADAGLECELYKLFKAGPICPSPTELSNGSTYSTREIVKNNQVTSVQSVGEAGQVLRAFEALV